MIISTMLNETVTIRQRSGISVTGDASYGAASTIAARIENRSETVRNFRGEEVEASHVIYTLVPTDENTIFYLDSADAGSLEKGLEPLAVWKTPSLNAGTYLYKAWLTFFK